MHGLVYNKLYTIPTSCIQSQRQMPVGYQAPSLGPQQQLKSYGQENPPHSTAALAIWQFDTTAATHKQRQQAVCQNTRQLQAVHGCYAPAAAAAYTPRAALQGQKGVLQTAPACAKPHRCCSHIQGSYLCPSIAACQSAEPTKTTRSRLQVCHASTIHAATTCCHLCVPCTIKARQKAPGVAANC
jgi:hypothetical protein